MEVRTTMVSFSYFKEAMEKKTDKAQLFLYGNKANPGKIWVPFTKLKIEDDPEREGYNLVTMPKWLYLKTLLPLYTEVHDEFIITSEVEL